MDFNCLAFGKVKALVAAAADPNRVDREGGTPLRAAVAAGCCSELEVSGFQHVSLREIVAH